MANSSFSFNEILGKLESLGDGDILRGSLQLLVQTLINLELEEKIGAAHHERTETRTNHRNGSRERELETRLGSLNLSIPKLRQGSFFPSLLQPRKRAEQALLSVVQEAYVAGVSTRKVDELAQALGLEGMDKSKVSRACQLLDKNVAEFRERPLTGHYPYIWLDATYIKIREGGRVQNQAFIVAIGLSSEGRREVLGFTVGHAENYHTWLNFLRSLVSRGLTPPLLTITDAHEGVKKAVSEVFTGSSWQRCRVHFTRNVIALVPKSQQNMALAAVKQIFQQPDHKSATLLVGQVAAKLEDTLPKIASKLLEECHEALHYMHFPQEHWRQIHSTNGLERLNRELKRRADVVGIFPSQEASVRLLGSILQEQDDEWQICNKVHSQESLKRLLAMFPLQDTIDSEQKLCLAST
ncbi:MAG: IS256 family transposase [Anaerolineae bacterium]